MNYVDLCLSVSSSCLVEVASIEQLLLFYFRFVFCEQARGGAAAARSTVY